MKYERLTEIWAADWAAWRDFDRAGSEQYRKWASAQAESVGLSPIVLGVEWIGEGNMPLITALSSDDRLLYSTFQASSEPPCWLEGWATTIYRRLDTPPDKDKQ